jgi:hypothetical protein
VAKRIPFCGKTQLNCNFAGLEAKADKKLQDFYTIKERGNWQDPLFFAHCFL